MSRLIFIFLGIVAILSIGFFLIWPKYQKFENLKIEIENKELELRQTEDYFAKLERTAKDLEEYRDQISKIDLALPGDSSFATISLINFIGKASSVNGLILKKLKSFSTTLPKPPAQTPGTQTQPQSKVKDISINFEVSGSYFALKNFINTLENSAKIIEIENLSFSVEKEEVPSIDLKIKTFSY